MKFSFYTDDVTKLSAGLLGMLVFEEQVAEGTIFKAIDQRLDGLVTRLVGDEQFKGKKGQTLTLHTHGRVGPQRLLLVGGGARKDLQPSDLRGFAARVVKAGAAAQAPEVAAVLPYLEGGASPTTAERAAQFLAEGASLGAYKFDKYLTGDKKKPFSVEEVKIVASSDNVDGGRLEALKRGSQRGVEVANGVALARDLINEPAGDLTVGQVVDGQ